MGGGGGGGASGCCFCRCRRLEELTSSGLQIGLKGPLCKRSQSRGGAPGNRVSQRIPFTLDFTSCPKAQVHGSQIKIKRESHTVRDVLKERSKKNIHTLSIWSVFALVFPIFGLQASE